MSHRDVGSKIRDIDGIQKTKSLERRNVDNPYFGPLSVTSRRWPQRRDIRFQHTRERGNVRLECCEVGLSYSLECHDVGISTLGNIATLDSNVATSHLFYDKKLSVFFFYKPWKNPKIFFKNFAESINPY